MTRKKDKKSRAVAKVVAHFKDTYTFPHNDDRLLAFQNMCRDLHVNVGNRLEQCRKNIKNANVNIHDFVRTQEAGGDVSTIKYPTNKALRSDMRKHRERRFPLNEAEEDELIEAMLVRLSGD